MSTPEGCHEYTGDFGTSEKNPRPNFEDFCSRTFCDYAVVYVGFWKIRQLVKISPSGSTARAQSLKHFLFHL